MSNAVKEIVQTVELDHDNAFFEQLDLPTYLQGRDFETCSVELRKDEDYLRLDVSCKDKSADISIIAELDEERSELHVCEIDKGLDSATQRSYSKAGAFRVRTASWREGSGFVTRWAEKETIKNGKKMDFQKQMNAWEDFLTKVEEKLTLSSKDKISQ